MIHEAGQGYLHAPDVLRSPDRPLAGKTAIVTGGSRDVGAAIVQSLTREGVNVAFSYNNKPKRADEVLAAVAEFDGEAHAFAADISTPDGRASFFTSALDVLGGNIDYLILSTSGPTPDLNEIASNDLLDQTLLSMRNHGVVIRMQSVPGHFMPQLRGSFSLKEYNRVAENKYPDVKSLRRRIPEMGIHGVRFIEVCPPIVTGTNNVRFAHRLDPTAEEQHYVVSDKLGLPREVSPEQVGDRIVELLSRTDLKSGYTEFFDGVSDVQTALESVYDVPQVYVGTLERLDDSGEQKHSIGRAIISVEQAARSGEPEMIDDLARRHGAFEGMVRITPDHARGHFSAESGLPQVLPGHKQIRAAVDMIELIQRRNGRAKGRLRLAGFESAEFSNMVIADGKTTLAIYTSGYKDGTYDVALLSTKTGETTALIKGLRVREETEADQDTLLEDQIIEGAAQTVGITQADENERKMPLLRRVGRVEFISGGIRGGDGIVYDAFSKNDGKKGVKGSVSVYSEGRTVGTVGEIEAVLVSEKAARRLLDR